MRTRPREWEENAIRALIDVTTAGSRVHIAHLADAQRCAVLCAPTTQGLRRALTFHPIRVQTAWP